MIKKKKIDLFGGHIDQFLIFFYEWVWLKKRRRRGGGALSTILFYPHELTSH